MTQTVDTAQDQYARFFGAAKSRTASEPEWLRTRRETAFEAFSARGFPIERRGNEEYKYTDIRPIARAEFTYPDEAGAVDREALLSRIPSLTGELTVVFVDGRFSHGLSSALDREGVTIRPLQQAVESDGALLEANLGRAKHGPFAALNTALFADGAFIHVTGAVSQPIHLVFATSDGASPIVTFPRTLVVAAPMSEVTVLETYVSLGEGNHFTDAFTEIVLEDGAKVDHYRLLLENTGSYHVGTLRTTQGRDSSFASMVYEAGSGLGRLDADTLFDAPGSEARLRGLYVTHGEQHMDNVVSIDHAQPHNTSRLYYKGILDDKSSAAFGGTVFVRPGADKTDAHQEDKNLLLSHEAEVDSKPALEIYADDVKAGHGATAGAIADEAIFYMRSRGLDAETAEQFLVRGFASEILDTVTIDELREWLEVRTTAALPRFRRKS